MKWELLYTADQVRIAMAYAALAGFALGSLAFLRIGLSLGERRGREQQEVRAIMRRSRQRIARRRALYLVQPTSDERWQAFLDATRVPDCDPRKDT